MQRLGSTLSLALTLAACSSQPRALSPSWDTPVPASEPRAELELTLDLPPVSDCDERFALALYQDRGVELLTWDEQGQEIPRCSERRVTIRYLSRRLTRDALLQRVREVSTKFQVVKR